MPKFPYRKFPSNPNEAFPDHKNSLRPVIPIKLIYKDKSASYLVLLDSGADFCIFHTEIGEAIGINIKSGKKLEYFGIEGNKQSAYFHDINIELQGGIKFNAYVGFSYDFNKNMPYGVLGQKGFWFYSSDETDRPCLTYQTNPYDTAGLVKKRDSFEKIVLCYVPTLSELIEACGRTKTQKWVGDQEREINFVLWFNGTNWSAGYYVYGDENYIDDYPNPDEQGSTPEEAVANLWLRLNKK